MKNITTVLMGAALAAAVPSGAEAATLIVDVSGSQSFSTFGAAGNSVRTFNIGAGSTLIGIAYDVTITAFSPSWLSEAAVAITNNSATDGLFLRPGFDENESGTGTYADSVDLVAEGLDFAVGEDGLLRLEFFDTFDDPFVAPDAIWNSGTITFTFAPGAIPEPATWAMMIGGFGLVGAAMRRRERTSAAVA